MKRACVYLVALAALCLHPLGFLRAEDEKPEKPAAVKKDGKPSNNEQPAKEKPQAAKKNAEQPVKKQPEQEKPAAAKKDGKLSSKEQPTKEQPQAVKKAGEAAVKKQSATPKPAAVKKEPARQGTIVQGAVKRVDSEKRALTVVLTTNDTQTEQTFGLAKEARVFLGGKQTNSLDDLKPGLQIAMLLDEQKTIQVIKSYEKGKAPAKKDAAK